MKNKKAVSIMIGYILLVTAAVVMGVIIYQWLKTYVPKEALECPDDVSIFIKDYICEGNELNLTLQNNGKFSVAGYFIHVKNESGQKIATIDLSKRLITGGGEKNFSGAVIFAGEEENSFEPAEEASHKFDLTDIGNIYLVEISPARFQEVENEKRFANCGNSKIEEEIECGEGSEEEIPTCSDGIMNGDETGVDCGGSCPACPTGTIIFLEDGFENTDWDINWDGNGITTWARTNSVKHSGTYSAYSSDEHDGYLTSDNIDTSDVSEIHIEFWYRLNTDSADDFKLYYYGDSYILIDSLGSGAQNTWLKYDQVITDTQYIKPNFRIRFSTNLYKYWGSEYVWLDDINITGSVI